MKNFSEIQNLLDRYWDGETTLEEERTLKAYFASGEVDERFSAVAPLFQVLRQEKSVQSARTAEIQPQAPVLRVRRFPVAYFWAAAASLALLLTAGWWWLRQPVETMQPVVKIQPQQGTPKALQTTPDVQKAEQKMASTKMPPVPVLAKKSFSRPRKVRVQPIDPETEAAMKEIKAALALVSSKMRKGQQEAAKGAVHLESMDRIFKKKEG